MLSKLLGVLEDGQSLVAAAAIRSHGFGANLDPGMARQEYLTNGQQVGCAST